MFINVLSITDPDETISLAEGDTQVFFLEDTDTKVLILESKVPYVEGSNTPCLH